MNCSLHAFATSEYKENSASHFLQSVTNVMFCSDRRIEYDFVSVLFTRLFLSFDYQNNGTNNNNNNYNDNNNKL